MKNPSAPQPESERGMVTALALPLRLVQLLQMTVIKRRLLAEELLRSFESGQAVRTQMSISIRRIRVKSRNETSELLGTLHEV